MDINWADPDVVSLHERLAACIQEQLEMDLTSDGRVAAQAYFGSRAAADILMRAVGVDVAGSSGEWSISFTADPPPDPNICVGCAVCGAREGEIHDQSICPARGIQRARRSKVQL